MHHYEKQLDETIVSCKKAQENMKQRHENEMHTLEKQISDLKMKLPNFRGKQQYSRRHIMRPLAGMRRRRNNCKRSLRRKRLTCRRS